MSFYYEARKTASEALRIETIFRQNMAANQGGGFAYEQLRRQGLGYRKTVMLEDYRRFQAVDRALTPEARQRAETWYDKVYEPFRKAGNMNAAQATKKLREIREGTIETVEQAEASRDYTESYEKEFS